MSGPRKTPAGGPGSGSAQGTGKGTAPGHDSTTEQPTAADFAAPVTTFWCHTGHSVDMLRPYWQRHPEVSVPIPGTELVLATWRDGLQASVPVAATPHELAEHYLAASVQAQLEGLLS